MQGGGGVNAYLAEGNITVHIFYSKNGMDGIYKRKAILRI